MMQRLKEIYQILFLAKQEVQKNHAITHAIIEEVEGEIILYYITLLDDDFIVDVLKAFNNAYPKVDVGILQALLPEKGNLVIL